MVTAFELLVAALGLAANTFLISLYTVVTYLAAAVFAAAMIAYYRRSSFANVPDTTPDAPRRAVRSRC